ncbi:MAG: hypothetical protein Fur0010_24370 [Bdellovibrio sp.]
MILLDSFLFLLRYIPFWAIPVMMISIQFGYMYWLKEVPRAAYVCVVVAAICSLFIIYYLWAGTPDNSAQYFLKFFNLIQE